MLWYFHGLVINVNTGLYNVIMTASDVVLLSLVARPSLGRNRGQKPEAATGNRNRVAPTQDLSRGLRRRRLTPKPSFLFGGETGFVNLSVMMRKLADQAAFFNWLKPGWLGVAEIIGENQLIYLILGLVLLGLTGGVAAGLLGENRFDIVRLLCDGLFWHGFAVMAGLAWLLWRREPLVARTCCLGAIMVAALGIYAFRIEPYWLEISRVQLKNDKLEQPVKIVVVADLQSDVFGEYERKSLRLANDAKGDIILFVGDYAQESEHHVRDKSLQDFKAALQEINIRAPQGIYAVRGTLETGSDWNPVFAGLPVRLVEQTETIERPNLCLTGLSLTDSENTQLFIPDCGAKFHVVFGHVPNFALGDVRGDLLVAGHTHGGQLRIPFIGPLATASEIPHQWGAGITDLGNGRTLLVSRGIGMELGDDPRFRFLCRPEMVNIE